MATEKIVEVIYGKYHKFEIVKKSDFWGIEFYIRKDGNPYKGSYSTLAAAVAAAEKEG